jgi:C-terminal processing protease CtpA/Prc
MNGFKLLVIFLIILPATILSTSACHIFLGPDPDSSPRGIFEYIWNDYNETYALFNVKGINWNEKYAEYSPQIQDDMSDYDLFRVCAKMLNSLNDFHVWLSSPFAFSFFWDYNDYDDYDNYKDYDYAMIYWERSGYLDIKSIRNSLKDEGTLIGKPNSYFLYGTFKERLNIGYIYISDFNDYVIGVDVIPDWTKEIDNIVKSLRDTTDALIIDIRSNGGGLGSNVDYIASRFVSVEKPYLKSRVKTGPGTNDFSAFKTWTIKPAGITYTKRVVLLTNEGTSSAAEWLVMALRTQPHVIHMGSKTAGGFSPRIVRPLINGWYYSISVMEVTDINGKCFEGEGIHPENENKIEFSSINDIDMQLMEVLYRLSP